MKKGTGLFQVPFLLPGRPKTKNAPSGGSKPKAQRGSFFICRAALPRPQTQKPLNIQRSALLPRAFVFCGDVARRAIATVD
ncbi:hypothetical protein [Bordetella genomosp. 4]|uniref:hypothetical protein n=1 Tax=Bordetella genomosp. 4 TaxID=463044 RepID=UPI000B9E73B0|nr:hypothetical protein [Bordetella genomosp. 4]OZI48536.1 hypothetical protein CAL21_11835 [Bordetella genomosp. 4]